MIDHDEFFKERKAAAVMKHGVLRYYTKVFTTMVGSWSDEVWVIDAYAGPGEYASDETTDPAPGSPRILCEVASSVTNCRVRGYFIEPDPTHSTQLQALVNEIDATGRHIVRTGTAETHLPTALAATGTSPVLLFLDPFGVALSFDSLVTALAQRPRRAVTEILLNFNVESLRRIGGYLAKKNLRDDPVLTRVDAFVGGDWWREVFSEARAADEFGRAAIAAEAVVRQFNLLVGERLGLSAIAVPVRRRPGTSPLFVLNLYYRNDAAAAVFADAASAASRDWRDFHKRQSDDAQSDDGLFSPAELRGMSDQVFRGREESLAADWVASIKQNILQLLAAEPEVRVLSRVTDLYGDTLGQAREMHLRMAWDALSKEGRVAVRDKSGKLRDKTIRRAEA